MGILDKVNILTNALIGVSIKTYIKLTNNFYVKDGLNKKNQRKEKVIISVTSYGRRVTETLPYTLISILKQTVKPDKVIVWLDNLNWSEESLPPSIKELQKLGIEVLFCEDIRSYKKIIPTLSLFPNDIIITIDDDIYYNSGFIERLYLTHNENPKAICCNIAHLPKRNNIGELLPYSNWEHNIKYTENKHIFPVGVGGILYPPDSLDQEVMKQEQFMKLAPYADDIWLWLMGSKNNTPRVLVKSNKTIFWNFDFFHQYFNKESGLTYGNVKENRNDIQIKNILSQYKIDFSE